MFAHRTALTLASAGLASVLLVGCSAGAPPDTSQDQARDQAQDTAQGTDAQVGSGENASFDTGTYRSEPHSGWPRDDDKIGQITELTEIGSATLLPYEVDERFSHGGAAIRQSNWDALEFGFPDVAYDAMQGLAGNFLHGFTRLGLTETGNEKAELSLLRFTDAESAQRAAELFHDTILEQGGKDPSGERYGLEPVDIPGQPGALATLDPRTGTLRSALAVDEFVLYTVTLNIAHINAEAPGEAEAALTQVDWMPQFHADFLTKQTPLIATIATRKTPEGFGKSDQWPEADPDDLLRFAVMPADNTQKSGRMPAWANARMMAGNYSNVGERFVMFEQADILAMAQAETLLYRTANQKQAELLRATLAAEQAESEREEYTDPQGVPGTTCFREPTHGAVRYSCTLVYENYFAEAFVSEIEAATPDVGAKPSAEDDPAPDAKTQLSQMMAAQYLLLQQAPKP